MSILPTSLGVTIGSRSRGGEPVVEDVSYGAIVDQWITSGNASGDQLTRITQLQANAAGPNYIVKYHMDYTKVLEDAIKSTVYDLASSVFFYSGSLDLRVDVTAQDPSLQQGNVWNVRGLLSGKGLESGAYYRIICSPDTQGAILAGVYISPKTDFSGSVRVDVGDAVVINKDGGFDLIDNAETSLTSNNADLIVVPGAVQGQFDLAINNTGPYANALAGSLTSVMNDGKAYADTKKAEAIAASNAYTDSSVATLDAAVTARDDSVRADLNASISAETSRATAAEASLTSDLGAETTRATAAEGVLRSDLDAEVTRATAAESALTADLSSEVSRAQTAELSLRSDLTSEVGRATAAESSLSTALATESSRALAAETSLAADLAAELVRAQAAEAAAESSVVAEQTRATGVETQLQADLSSEIATRIAKDASTDADLAAETSRATGAEGVLTASISSLASNVSLSMQSTAQRLKVLEAFVYATEQFIQISENGTSVMDFSNTLGAMGWPSSSSVDVAAGSYSATANAFADDSNPIVYSF